MKDLFEIETENDLFEAEEETDLFPTFNPPTTNKGIIKNEECQEKDSEAEL